MNTLLKSRPGCRTNQSLSMANTWRLVILCLLTASAIAVPTPSSDKTGADGLIASPEPGWPQWRGPRRDGVSEEKGLLPCWPEGGPKLLWKVDGLGRGWSSPIVTGGRLYVTGDVGSDLIVFALDSNGSGLWKIANGKAWKGPYPGARATCAFSQGRLYNMNAHGRVACVDAASGKELWAVDILDRFDAKNIRWALSECLLVDGGHVIVTPGGKKALMAALDKQDGKTVWTTPPLEGDRTSHCSPILFRHAGCQTITNCSSAHGFGVDADTGELLWTVPLKNRFGTNISTPVYGSGSVYFVTPYTDLGRLYRLSADAGGVAARHIWTCPLDTVTGCGVFVDGTFFAAGYKTSKWWFALDWQTGKIKYELKSLTTGAAIYADSRLYCLDEKGTIALLKADTDGFEVMGSFSIETGRYKDAWAHPVLLDGRLYIRHHDTLRCYDVSE